MYIVSSRTAGSATTNFRLYGASDYTSSATDMFVITKIQIFSTNVEQYRALYCRKFLKFINNNEMFSFLFVKNASIVDDICCYYYTAILLAHWAQISSFESVMNFLSQITHTFLR